MNDAWYDIVSRTRTPAEQGLKARETRLATRIGKGAVVKTRGVTRTGQDNLGEVYVLANLALGPYGTTGVVLKVARLFTGR